MAVVGPFDFRGGYSPGYEYNTLPQGKGYATTMENCQIKAGYVTPRWAQAAMSSASLGGTVLGLAAWNDTVNSKMAAVATSNSKLLIADATSYTPDATALTFTDRTGALAASSLSGLTTFDSLNNILVGSANSASSGVLFKVTAYNANGAVLGGSPPSADIVKQCNNFMFASRNLSSTTTQSKVYWSNVNDPETWTAANVLDFNKNDGEPVMALGSIGTDLYIFKKNSIGRLSTTTITTSGAVTLGPLTTVIRGIGCCGPRALDNLPNGNIVFVSFDGHFYEFDGSTVVDRSHNPYPGADAYNNGQYYSNQHSNEGLAGCVADTNVVVKTCRGLNEVWVGYTTSLNALGNKINMYDFEEGIWQGNTDTTAGSITAVVSMATLPIGSISTSIAVESTEFIIRGSSNGSVYAHGNRLIPYPISETGTAVTFSIGTTIHLQGNKGAPFIPRSLCFETARTNSANARLSALTVYAEFDCYSAINYSVYSGSGLLAPRIVVPLNFRQDPVGTNVFPSMLSLMWTGTGTSSGTNQEIFRLGKFWISDEAIR